MADCLLLTLVVSLFLPPVQAVPVLKPLVQTGENLCSNGGFETLGEDGFPVDWEPFLSATPPLFKGGQGGGVDTVEATDVAHSGERALRLVATGQAPVGLNRAHSPGAGPGALIPLIRGFARFWYRAESSASGGDNLRVYLIAMSGDGGMEVGRQTFRIPAAHVGDGDWHQGTLEFDFSHAERAKFVHFAPRINEGGTPGPGELLVDSVEVMKLGPRVAVESFGVSETILYPDETARVGLTLRNLGGQPLEGLTATLDGPEGLTVEEASTPEGFRLEPEAETTLTWTVRAAQPTFGPVAVELAAPGCRTVSLAQTVVVSNPPPPVPEGRPFLGVRLWAEGETICLANEAMQLTFVPNPFGYGVVAVDAYSRAAKRWERVAMLPWLLEVRYLAQGGVGRQPLFTRIDPRDLQPPRPQPRAELSLAGPFADADGVAWRAEARFALKTGEKRLHLQHSLAANAPRQILRFEGPRLLVGDSGFGAAKQRAWFPGLEYLEGEEASSSTLDAHPPHHDRRAPHPYKVTIPLLGVSTARFTVGLMWDALQKWDGEHFAPTALFASPNFLGGQENHLFALSAPSVPQWVAENEEDAFLPYELQPGRPLRLESWLVVDDRPELEKLIHHYLDVFGYPPKPTEPRSVEEALRLSLDSAERRWVPEQHGWYPTSAWERGASPNPDLALFLWLDSLRTNDAAKRELWQARVRDVAEHLGGGRGIDLALHLGGVADALAHEDSAVQGLVQSQRLDGSWGFSPGEGRESLGERGQAVSGTVANPARMLLRHAQITGDPKTLEAGLRALQFLKTCALPRGGQTWEVPLHTPDVIVAGQAIDACLDAYEITGEEQYVAEAERWAYTALPFYYFWQAPDRPIMAYASIPVLGASLFVNPWFGRPVQWCGIVPILPLFRLADILEGRDRLPGAKVPSFLRHRQVPHYPELWRTVAEGATRAAMQQQLDWDGRMYPDTEGGERTSDIRHPKSETFWRYPQEDLARKVGLYPDNFSLLTNEVEWNYMISPNSHYPLTRCLYYLLGVRAEALTRVLPVGKQRLHVTSAARIGGLVYGEEELTLVLQHFPGVSFYTLLAGVSLPQAVTAEGRALAASDDLEAAPEGYQYLAGRSLLLLKLAGSATVRLRGLKPQPVRRPDHARQTRWEFDEPGDSGGFYPVHDIARFTVAQGRLQLRTMGEDPWIQVDGLELEAEQFQTLRLRMRVSAGGNGQIFWGTLDAPGTAEARSVSFPLQADGEFHEYAIPLPPDRGWRGQVRLLRLDPVHGPENVEVEIDWVRLEQPEL